MKSARTGKTIIPKIYAGNKFTYIAEKVWNGSEWIKIDYYSMSFILSIVGSLVTLHDFIELNFTIDNNLIA